MRIASVFVLLGACALACGGSTSDGAADDEIVNGAPEARFAPVGYLALDQDRSTRSFTPFCTATLIAPRVVVTAAHCVHDIKHSVRPEGPWMTFSRGTTTSTTRTPVYVKEIYEDPGFDPTDPRYFELALYANDFALLVLETAITDTTPARIASADPSREHLAVGYGRTKTGPFDLVEEGPMKRKSLPMKLAGGSASTHYLADPVDGAVCYGDSGGPLLDVGPAQNGSAARESVIVGVLATMFGVDPQVTCAPGTRTAYASLVAKRPFIDAVLAAVSGGAPVEDLVVPSGRALPFGRSDVLRIGNAREVDMMSALATDAAGAVTVVFDRSDAAFTRSSLQVTRSPDGHRFARPRELAPPARAFVGSPSFVSTGAGTFLYFASADGYDTPPSIHRARLDGATAAVASVEDVAPIAGVDWFLSWPGFTAVSGGGVAGAFRDGAGIPHFTKSSDGRTFTASRAVVQQVGAMVTLGEAKDGTLAIAFQTTTATEPMVSSVVLSRDGGTTWSAPVRLSPESNVHDASFVARSDGGLDAYYIYPPAGAAGFSLFRRSISTTGTLGPEQRITAAEAGQPSKPKALRTKDGKVLLAYADIAERAPSGEPVVQQIVLAELGGDAPR